MLAGMLALAGTGTIYILTTTGSQNIDLLTMVPRQSGAVLTWDHPIRAYQRFALTRSGENIGGMDPDGLLAALGMPDADILTILTCGKLWHDLKEKRFVQDILKEKIVLALVPADGSTLSPSRPALQPLFLAAVTKQRTVDRFISCLRSRQYVTPLPPLNWRGYTIYGVTIENIGPLYVSHGPGAFLAALDPAPIRQSLDLLLARMKSDGKTITENQYFLRFIKQAKGLVDFFCYLDPEILANKGLGLPAGHELTTRRLQNVLHDLVDNGLRRLALYHRREQKFHQLGLFLQFDRQALPPFQKSLADRPPSIDAKLARTTDDLQLYLRSNWLDLPVWWQMRVHDSADRDLERAERLDIAVRKYTGMEMERFLGLFGHRFSVIVKEFKRSVFFIPRLCLGIALQDKTVFRDLLAKFVSKLPHQRESVAGVEVMSILAAGGMMQPALGLAGHDLFLVDGRDMVNDLLAPGSLLINDPDFTQIAFGIDQPANLIFFARMAQVAQSLKEASYWFGALIGSHGNSGRARNRILVEQLAIPVFDGLTMFKSGFVIGRTRPGELDVTARLLVSE